MGIRKKIRRKLAILGGQTPEPRPTHPLAAPVRKWTPEPEPESPRGEENPADFIAGFVKTHPVVLFMKGNASAPQCGFSASAVGILSSYGATLKTFDVLIDPEVREAVKQFSSWPTIPQTYIGGEFVGGSDILTQMHEAGDLKDLIKKASA
jgi:monothiol glutaredoxin